MLATRHVSGDYEPAIGIRAYQHPRVRAVSKIAIPKAKRSLNTRANRRKEINKVPCRLVGIFPTLLSVAATIVWIHVSMGLLDDSAALQDVGYFDGSIGRADSRSNTVTHITLSHNMRVKTLRPLLSLRQLRELNVRTTSVTSIEPLRRMHLLERLNIAFTGVRDLAPISHLHNIRSLSISGTPVSSLSALGGLVQLQELQAADTNIQSLAPVSRLTELRRLYIDNTRVQDLSPLKGMHKLEVLDIRGTEVSDLSVVSSLVSLEQLDLRGTFVRDISALLRSRSLRVVKLDEGELDREHVRQLDLLTRRNRFGP